MADAQNNAKTQIITNRGLELLGKSPLTGANQTYWLGYFGFAYVPDEIKEQYPDEVPSAASTTLTEHGDMIYNIWQGSMTPKGYQTDIGSSNAAELMTQCQYTNNIMSNFRYSLDKGRNTLSLYERNADGTVTQWGETFQGVGVDANDATQVSELPIPAALYYSTNSGSDGHVVTGDPRTYAANGNLWGDSSDDWNKEPTDVLDSTGKEYVSNFNKYHAPAISDGYLQGQEPSCRNMATVTKYFPVAHYTVTAAEGSKVSALKLTLTIDLNNIAAKVANRTNFATMGAKEKPLNPVGFKFNRIGIYAASMAVHHYTYDEENNQCEPVKDVQYQVIGDDEPVLFAIIDLDQAITIEEGSALGDWTTNIIINFGNSESADSQIPRDTVVYYNLYEDDSIVWYKNQLIANASTSEAVTNLGIELNYLKNQIENMRSGSSCVMVDDTPYALLNHTHDYMKNIVDTGEANNGAVRGIYTKPENTTVAGIEGTYSCGTDSITLGKDSATATAFSINVSNRGILGKEGLYDGDSSLLMGGVDDEDLVVKAKNSLLNMATGGALNSVNASLMLSDMELHAPFDYAVTGSIVTRPVSGLALSDDTDKYENIRYQWPVRLDSGTTNANIWNSILMGNNRYMGTMANVLALGNETGFRQSMTRIGEYDPLGDFDVETGYLPYVGGDVVNILLAGRNNKLHSGASQVIAVGDQLNIPEGSANVIVLGKYVNMNEKNWPRNAGTAYREYDDIISIDEFVERHDDADFQAAHATNGTLAIVGEGDIPSSCGVCNASGESVVANVRGVSLYIHYNSTQQKWIEDKSTRRVLDLCNATSRWQNILMLGEGSGLFNYAPGDKSKNSIFIGDDSAWSNTTFRNSFINLLGTSRNELMSHQQVAPKSYFDNVWFVGHLPNNGYSDMQGDSRGLLNNLDMEGIDTGVPGDVTPHVLSDIFVFNGKNENVFNLTRWLGISSDLRSISKLLYEVLRDTDHPTPYDVGMQHKSPTIYTGGIALGGSGSNNCTYGLMMLGHNFTGWSGYSSFTTGLKNIVNYQSSNSGSYFLDYPDDTNHAVVRYAGNGEDSDRFALFRLSHDGTTHAGRPGDGSDQSYDAGDEKFCMLSPHTGKVLMVQDHQELDGTLHVGLGAYSDWNYPGQVIISSQYIAGSERIGFSVVMTRNGEPYKYQDTTTATKVGRHYDHFYLSKDDIADGTDTYYHRGKFGVHFAIQITKSVAADTSVNYTVDSANIYIEPMPGTMYVFGKCSSTDNHMGFSPNFTQSTYVNGLAGFDELNIGICYSSLWRDSRSSNNFRLYYPSLKLSIGSGDADYLVDSTGFAEIDHVCEYISDNGDCIYKLSPLRVNDQINSTHYNGNYESSVRYFKTFVYNAAHEDPIEEVIGYYRYPYVMNKLSIGETSGVRYT